jgi:hypothetical protein
MKVEKLQLLPSLPTYCDGYDCATELHRHLISHPNKGEHNVTDEGGTSHMHLTLICFEESHGRPPGPSGIVTMGGGKLNIKQFAAGIHRRSDKSGATTNANKYRLQLVLCLPMR